MNLKTVLLRTLDDEYEASQLVPVYSKQDGRKKDVEPSQEQVEELRDKLPAAAELKLRCAVFEAVVDDIVEDKIEEAVQNNVHPDTETIIEEVEPLVNAAETLRIIPKFNRRNLHTIISRHLTIHDPLCALADKAAHFCAGVMTDIKEEDLTAGEVKSDGSEVPGEIKENTDATVISDDQTRTPEDPISAEVVEMEPGQTSDATVESDPVLPEETAKAMRYLAASAVNHRKAAAIMSRRVSGIILGDMLHQLRYRLPKSFKQKYGINE